MRVILLSLVAASVLLPLVSRAAEPPPAAQTRADLYQSEVRTAFEKKGWYAVEDKPGRLEVEHALRYLTTATVVYAPGKTFAHLSITFQPDSVTHTATSVKAARYIRGYQPGFLAYPPLSLPNPEVKQAYSDALGQAEAQLAAEHPNYRASAGHGKGTKSRGSSLAMN